MASLSQNVPDILKETPPQALATGPDGIHHFLQRAAELFAVEPVISYWTAYYAAQIALSRPGANPATQTYLIRLLDHLESFKVVLSKDYLKLVTEGERAREYVLAFAQKVFDSADDEDRAGKANKRTAKTFLAASQFLTILKIWADKEDNLGDEVTAKIKYAKWKAADIVKAIKDGRKPAIGDGLEPDASVMALEAELNKLQVDTETHRNDHGDIPARAADESYPFPSLAAGNIESDDQATFLPPLSPSQQPGAPKGSPRPEPSSMTIHHENPTSSVPEPASKPAFPAYPAIRSRAADAASAMPPAPRGTPSPDPATMRPDPPSDIARSYSVTAPRQPPVNGLQGNGGLPPPRSSPLEFEPGQIDKTEEILMEPYSYLAAVPGKDIRARLIEAFDLWLQVPADRMVIIQQVVEMLHTASLLMDDVEDNSDLRRGVPVAHKIYGVAQTINSANFVYFKALDAIDRLGRPAYHTMIIEELLNLHRGQGLDLYWRDTLTCPTEQEYLNMVSNKTGGLFRIAIKLLVAEATHPVQVDYVPLVNLIGIYFQIRDDYMNLQSEVYTSNKGFAEDLTEGKFSFPIIHAVRADPSNRQILNILKQHPTESSVKEYTVQLISKFGSFSYTLDVLASLDAKCRAEIQAMGGNAALDIILDALALSPTIASPIAHPLVVRSPFPQQVVPPGRVSVASAPPAPSPPSLVEETKSAVHMSSARATPNETEERIEPLEMTSQSLATTQKHAKTVISALDYEDLSTARRELEAALDLVRRMQGS